VIAASESLPDVLRATAALIRMHHGPRCPDAAVWRARAVLLDAAADGRGDVAEAIRVATEYLTAGEPAEVPA
jgi:hypothetical protein